MHLSFTFGLPGECHNSIDETIDLALQLSPDSVQFSIATPYPGTPFYAEAQEEGWLLDRGFDDFICSRKSVIQYPSLGFNEIEDALVRAYLLWYQHTGSKFRITAPDSSGKRYDVVWTVGNSVLKVLRTCESIAEAETVVRKLKSGERIDEICELLEF